MQTIGINNDLNKTYEGVLDVINPAIESALYPTPISIDNGAVLDDSAFGKYFLVLGDGIVRSDITLPTISGGMDGKKITFIGSDSSICARLKPDLINNPTGIDYRPYVEIGAGYTITLTVSDEINAYVISSLHTPSIIWSLSQNSQGGFVSGVAQPIVLSIEQYDPLNICADSGGGYFKTYLKFYPGYYRVICQVLMNPGTSPCNVQLQAYRNGSPVPTLGALSYIVNSTYGTVIYEYFGYFDGVNNTELSFVVTQDNVTSTTQTVNTAYAIGNFVAIGP